MLNSSRKFIFGLAKLQVPKSVNVIKQSSKQQQLKQLSTNVQQENFQNNSTLSPYLCTLENNFLSKEQRDFYEKNGYLVVKNMVTSFELERWHKRFNEYATGERKPESAFMVLLREVSSLKTPLNERALYKINELYVDEVFFEYCKHPKVLDHVQCITGPNIMSINSMLINKPPDSGTKSSRHPLHQDLFYFPFRPADRIVCAWTAMEKINRDNGCLVVVPGSHKGPLLEHEYPEWEGGVNKLFYGIKDLSVQDQRVHVILEPGDTVLFHSSLIHGSGMNRTKGFRKAISCHYAPVEVEFITLTDKVQKRMSHEFEEMVKKKSGDYLIDYTTSWKLRARLVRGEGEYVI